LLPCVSPILCVIGCFWNIDKMIAHAVLYGSHGFIGLSPAIPHCLVYMLRSDPMSLKSNPPPM
jgi:hypothetical protein